jgi:hypothetical protein
MDRQGDTSVSKVLKQPLALILLLSAFVQPALANDVPPADGITATAPAQAPVQLGWDRVGDRERNWV